MALQIYNSLTRKKEEFKPINSPSVGMYTCGPTVYDFMHIGNLRTFLLSDILYRTLVASGYKVKLVMNITDIEDKIIKRAKERNITPSELTSKYTKAFKENLQKLNILPADVNPHATEYISQMVEYIKALVEKGLAYEKDGSVYFDISKFPEYGKLSGVETRELKTGTRILSDEYAKEDVQDFALWKAVDKDEVGMMSPWGWGRPGWHIECSVMSQEQLGETLDIHVGGIDLMFPHHENEIAQSEGKTGKKFVNYFVHGEFLLVDGKKMSKSLGNYYTLCDIEEKGFTPASFRYLVLTAHYKDQMNFTWESLKGAQTAYERLKSLVSGVAQSDRTVLSAEKEEKIDEYREKFWAAVNNDLNMPQALSVVWEVAKSNIPSQDKRDLILLFDEVLGLGLGDVRKDTDTDEDKELSGEVKKLVEEREEARKNKDFKRSDELRDKLQEMGYEVEDTPEGTRVRHAKK
ncbi:MAG: cysteine--tRNA ligase [Candidatus Blackburnbacteria bacterium RIFCSPHIGHO2_02_FULL_39_13]|uniref:Cysteine--tRNA ligase n=2 Tax=Patescibacteria group TaxID=1783273 RepID=A0A0G1CBP9_9BACT|nr:MAG: Cysteinyl tRNA-synthetase [Candidatus Magasanikbacteria bacterium GW2011_GWA2_42_32]OGY07033.1 MAG: cysteine--tRNA ligase [Candidatus Blackburnbacteria bacterium RIFCSPHIGHO2_01_FULL_40_17]OGY08163.1 MAG: cysteine--tRNA ligase [Candidatus Blackburnbacteria bacterium RIFCSPHIGHO2_02_FULL_39_13]OGY13417.1 MAG: cysteine--tRNA ligase [Candidatus Blackburnbacteria bacterium RIFCSPLOWO2_01_FULL_40_20]OGY14687.1 MAG: cysteine--tRNA ligase [Candidatus Blackburnbacteria bacterium RIFCSPLOWO2_02_